MPRIKLEFLTKRVRKQFAELASVTGANAFNNLVGFLVQLSAAKTMGAANYGILSLALSVATMTGTIGDFGLNLATIRLYNKYQGQNETKDLLLGSIISLKILLLLFIVLLSFPIGNLLARCLLGNAGETKLFAIALLTGGTLFFWTYLQSYLQSQQLFFRLTVYIIAYAILRIIFLAVGYVLYPQKPIVWLMATYTLPVFILSINGVLLKIQKLIKKTFSHPNASLIILQEALSYSKWVAISGIAYTSLINLIRFVLAAFTSPAEVGIFSAGITFTMVFSTLNTSIRVVLFPKVTALESPKEIDRYLERIKNMAPYYFIFVVLGIIVLGLLQWYFLGAEYRAALPVFFITSLSLSLTIFLGLGTMLVHTMMKPQVDALVNIARLVLMLLLGVVLIPLFHAVGGAVAYALPVLLGEIWMYRFVKTKNAGVIYNGRS